MYEDRLSREQAFHDKRYGGEYNARDKADKYYAIFDEGPLVTYRDIISQHCRGRRLLEYGCGQGNDSLYWLRLGATVTGIDISSEAIKNATERASGIGYDIDYYVRDAEATGFADSSFDIIAGSGILHHLDLNNAFAELARILSPSGHAVFIEPLGHNPLINLYRRLTPSMRTEDEHPLKEYDLSLAKRFFANVEVVYYDITTLLSVPFGKFGIFPYVYKVFRSVDDLIFKVAPLRRYAWMVVLHVNEPIKEYYPC